MESLISITLLSSIKFESKTLLKNSNPIPLIPNYLGKHHLIVILMLKVQTLFSHPIYTFPLNKCNFLHDKLQQKFFSYGQPPKEHSS